MRGGADPLTQTDAGATPVSYSVLFSYNNLTPSILQERLQYVSDSDIVLIAIILLFQQVLHEKIDSKEIDPYDPSYERTCC